MPASRVESESKPEPKRWESDDYKADLTAHPEEIKDLCPIVITTIAAAPTQNKDILRLTKHKIHVCWYEGDGALLVRRPLNWVGPRSGRTGC